MPFQQFHYGKSNSQFHQFNNNNEKKKGCKSSHPRGRAKNAAVELLSRNYEGVVPAVRMKNERACGLKRLLKNRTKRCLLTDRGSEIFAITVNI